MNCPVCNAAESVRLVARSATPVFQNAVHSSAEAARSAASGSLEFRRCNACHFVWNAAFDPGRIRYSEGYDNSQTHSEAFVAHLGTRIERILAALPDHGPVTIAEIGCGQGDFLRRLQKALPKDREMRAIGFDPAYRGSEGATDGVEIHAAYFTAETAGRLNASPDVIVSRHTIEHVPSPVAFLQAIHSTTGDKPTRLFLETPDSEWILRNDAFHDFFYEHCSIFNFRSIDTALRSSGFLPDRLEACFDGQYLWTEAVATQMHVDETARFNARSDGFVEIWRDRIAGLKAGGRIALWGAGAKGATFSLMIDPKADLIDVVVDNNPGKSGAYIPVTAHPIVLPENMGDVSCVIVMNPNYEQEIRAQLRAMGKSPDVVVLR